MIQKYFFLILMLVPCIASSSNQVDSIISDLKLKNEILQDSVAYLLKQTSEIQKQLKNMISSSTIHSSEKKIAELEMMISSSRQVINQLLQWKTKVNEENRLNTAKNLDLLNQRSEIVKLKNDLEKVSRHENAVEMKVEKQVIQMGYLLKEVDDVKNNLPPIKKGMQYLMRNIQSSSEQLERTAADLKKKDTDFEEFKENTIKLNETIQNLKGQFKKLVHKLPDLIAKAKP